MLGPISQFGPLEFLIPLLPKHLFSSSLSHKMKAMYSTVQFHRQNILNDQQISQKHTFNRLYSARYNTIKVNGILRGVLLSWADFRGAALRWTLYENSLSILFSLSLLLFWDMNIMGLGYSWWNMHLQNILSSSNMFILHYILLFYIVLCTLFTCSFISVFQFL